MPGPAIKIEQLSKAYQIGEIGTGTLTRDIARWFARIRGKSDPFLRIDETAVMPGEKGDIVWSLKDINLDIAAGEAIGIIGPNGAGKSTLLKILSRVTAPTKGSVSGSGRIASLLEVGTGFHPELTGRENIFLNGAILGMRKKEIARKFDEIVEFAGVGNYIGTPVKRYSSGMYVRLAFAVAAHLESEILIIDEVLAVGDIEFQKKCLGKMGDINSGEGRTVLFVSHTMSLVKQLCKRTVLLDRGSVKADGTTREVISQYLSHNLSDNVYESILDSDLNEEISFKHIFVLNENNGRVGFIRYDDHFSVYAEFEVLKPVNSVEISITFRNSSGVNVLFTSLSNAFSGIMLYLNKGKYKVKAGIKGTFLLPDTYMVDICAHQRNVRQINCKEGILKFSIEETGSYMASYGNAARDFCCVLDDCKWTVSELS